MKCETAREIFEDAHWNWSKEKLNSQWQNAFLHIVECSACRDWIMCNETSLKEWFIDLVKELRDKP